MSSLSEYGETLVLRNEEASRESEDEMPSVEMQNARANRADSGAAASGEVLEWTAVRVQACQVMLAVYAVLPFSHLNEKNEKTEKK